jgi:hypothetical protein
MQIAKASFTNQGLTHMSINTFGSLIGDTKPRSLFSMDAVNLIIWLSTDPICRSSAVVP